MCGINGFNFPDATRIQTMNEMIRHRGPDDEGIFTDQNLSLGNVRLSIIDLGRSGRQPMIYQRDGRTAIIVYNGEIYNFLDLRRRLEERGYRFNSRTDTEVVLASYLEWGYECVNLFNGMWAFALYDVGKRVVFCSRDRVGKKPFYYYFDKKKFIFSSELKGILTHEYLSLNEWNNICREAVELYFGLGFIPSPLSIYKNTYKLEPGQNLVFDLLANDMTKWYYYAIPKYEPVFDQNLLTKQGLNLLRDATQLRMIADVPVGAFLSGGLDSTTIVALMTQMTAKGHLHTFSIGYHGKYDETPFADIAKDYFCTNHHHYYFTEHDFEETLQSYAFTYDEPLADYGAFPSYKLCREARKHVTVCLSGDGGDEIFGGYPEHVMGYRMDLIKRIPRHIRVGLSKVPARKNLNGYASLFLAKKAFQVSLSEPESFHSKSLEGIIPMPKVYQQWTSEKLASCLRDGANSMAEALRLYDLKYNTLADNYLAKVDRASMANSLEVRNPFLDFRVVEFSQRIPTKWKVDLFRTKIFMRHLIQPLVPKQIARRGKYGFVTPRMDWLLSAIDESSLADAMKHLQTLSPQWYHDFKSKILLEHNALYDNYKGRLFLFGKWMDGWIKKAETSSPIC